MLGSFARKEWIVSAAALVATVAYAEPPAAGVPEAATEVLRLPQALALALESSPELAPFPLAIRAAEARALQAGLLLNPRVGIEVEDVLGTGDFEGGRRAQLTLQLGQLVELGGKRAARVEAAGRETALARASYEEQRVEVLGSVTVRFLDVLDHQHQLALASEAVRLDRGTLRTVRRRLAGGAGSPLEETRAEVALAQSRVHEEDARHELAVARTVLAATWGAAVPAFGRVEGRLFERGPVPSWEDLEGRLGNAPEIVRRGAEERLREAELGLARAQGVPDLSLSAGPRRYEESDEQALVFGVSIPLPAFDRNQGGISEAEALARKSGAERGAAEVRLRALLYRLWQELGHAGHILDSLEAEVLPATENALAIAREGFERGRFSHLELLEARRAFLDARRRRIEAAASFHRFVLEIERVTGEPIEGAVVHSGEIP